MGVGPLHLLKHGLVERLQEKGNIIEQKQIETGTTFNTEIATTFQLIHKIKECVTTALDNKGFPLVVSGNCTSSVGTVAGYEDDYPGIIWFDAHGDCELPETTASGFLDGMAVSMLLGKSWKKKMAAITRYPLPPNFIILIGTRDLSTYEEDFLSRWGLNYITVSQLRENPKILRQYINRFTKAGIKDLHMHLDADVFDLSIAPASLYSSPFGLLKEEVLNTIKYCKDNLSVRSAGIAAYDPSYDKNGKMLTAIYDVINAFLA